MNDFLTFAGQEPNLNNDDVIDIAEMLKKYPNISDVNLSGNDNYTSYEAIQAINDVLIPRIEEERRKKKEKEKEILETDDNMLDEDDRKHKKVLLKRQELQKRFNITE